ncbi:HPP family protein [Roseateles asaccharophilus]|uniref:CBS-domain-containing membrane protein n=1 Tax=Roseateles asaccharophilus TaxID=582607 RepID=A0ABU2ACY4_9BURK|nr:HPP family protein [Roseateles asaccharophilus]MDR7335051.1 CBS-domain-containing membrane protein [Roseateles asaccharophilus]
MTELVTGAVVDVAPPSASRAPGFPLTQGAIACAGVFTIIGVLAFSSFNLGVLLALGSFGSTAVMVFTFPEIHFAQPRSVIGGHFICTAVGLAALALLGPSWWSLATAAAVATALMMLTRTLHPPAGSNPIIVFLAAPKWSFLFFPTLAGALVMVGVAVLYHRACRRPYPSYWY